MSGDWRTYDRPGHDVVGELLVHPPVDGPVPGRRRELYAWLPPGYAVAAARGRRFPVLFLHDGHSLFDPVLKASHDDPGIEPGDWRVDETMTALHAEGIDAVVVGLPNAGVDRVLEYTPWRVLDPDQDHARGLEAAAHPRVPGQAGAYVDWIADTVKPLVDATFATLPGRETTIVGGSSLGGIVSLVAYRRRPEVFGAAGVFSPAFWVLGEGSVDALCGPGLAAGRIYLDVGGRESAETPGLAERYERQAREAAGALGRSPGVDVRFVHDPQGTHHERAWAARLPDALRFLLGPGR